MKEQIAKYQGYNKEKLPFRKWESENTSPRAILQIIHGMAEHTKRYEFLAEFLTDKGFLVYAADHRGHGLNLDSHKSIPGDIGDDGFYTMVKDQKCFSKFIKDEHEDLPLFILGHSMGSFVLQEYLCNPETPLKGAIISGSNGLFGLDLNFAVWLAKLEMELKGKRKPANITDFLSFCTYNKFFKNEELKFAWLSRDRDQVIKYENDPWCGYLPPARFYYYFYKGLKELNTPEKLKNFKKNLPLYIFSGTKDPVGKYGKGVEALYEMYQKEKVLDLTLKLYPEGRHEMLNEINYLEVFKDLATWLEKHL